MSDCQIVALGVRGMGFGSERSDLPVVASSFSDKVGTFFASDRLPAALVVIGLALFAFDDISALRQLGGGFLASPSWAPILLATAMVLHKTVQKSDRPLLISLGAVWLYGLVLTLATLPIIQNEIDSDSSLSKSLKLAVTFAVLLSMVLAGVVLVRRLRKWVLVGATIALAIMVITAVIAQLGYNGIDDWGVIHSAQNFQMRVRGTRFEASSLGGGFLVLGGLIALLVGGRRGILTVIAAAALALVITQSRGTMIVALCVIVIGAIWWFVGRRVSNARRWFGYLIAGVAVAAALFLSLGVDMVLSSQWWIDIGLANSAGSTSDATRAAWATVSAQTLTQYPAGMGYAAYLEWLPRMLREIVSGMTTQFPPEALLELKATILSDDDTTLSAKTLPAVAITYFGWIGLLSAGALYFFAVVKSTGSRGVFNLAALPVAAMLVLVSSTYLWSVFSWDQMFLFGALLLGAAPRSDRDDAVAETQSEGGLDFSDTVSPSR